MTKQRLVAKKPRTTDSWLPACRASRLSHTCVMIMVHAVPLPYTPVPRTQPASPERHHSGILHVASARTIISPPQSTPPHPHPVSWNGLKTSRRGESAPIRLPIHSSCLEKKFVNHGHRASVGVAGEQLHCTIVDAMRIGRGVDANFFDIRHAP